MESAWYSFWEEQGLFKPRTEKDGSVKLKGKYVIAIPPPNVWTYACIDGMVIWLSASGIDVNFDVKTTHGYRKFCNKIYQATKYVLGKLGDNLKPCKSSALTGKESLPERWILTKMNTAAK